MLLPLSKATGTNYNDTAVLVICLGLCPDSWCPCIRS